MPGENPYDWEQHRAGILTSIAPAGLLEVAFAERVALLLWRLARLGRYQAAVVTAAVEDVGLPPPEADPLVSIFPAWQRDDDHLKATERNLRMGRRSHTEVMSAADLLRGLDEGGPGPVPADAAQRLSSWVHDTTADYPLRRRDPILYIEPEFLERIGAAGTGYKDMAWTAALLRAALGDYAGTAEARGRHAARLEAEVRALVRRSGYRLNREVAASASATS